MQKKGFIQAPFFKRLLAYLIDWIIINFIVVFPLEPLLKNYKLDILNITQQTFPKELTSIAVIIILLTLFYFISLESLINQTIGKLLMKIKVQSINGQNPTLPQVIIRNITKPFTILLIIDTLFILVSKNQRLFEKWSKTHVIKSE